MGTASITGFERMWGRSIQRDKGRTRLILKQGAHIRCFFGEMKTEKTHISESTLRQKVRKRAQIRVKANEVWSSRGQGPFATKRCFERSSLERGRVLSGKRGGFVENGSQERDAVGGKGCNKNCRNQGGKKGEIHRRKGRGKERKS